MKYNRLLKLPLLLFPISIFSCASKEVTVTFQLNNAESDVVIKIPRNSIIQDAPSPESYGKIFLNWRLDDNDFDIKNTPITNDITLSAHYKYDRDFVFTKKLNAEVKKGDSNLRMMSYNLLASVWNNKPPHHGYGPTNIETPNDGRDDQARDTIKRYQPDIIGLQECDQTSDNLIPDGDHGWYDYFHDQYEADSDEFPYIIINDDDRTFDAPGKGPYTLYSTIAYNSKTVELEEYGTYLSEYSDNDNCRYLTYGVFHLKNTDKKFVATSTHWNLNRPPIEKRIHQAEESARLSLELQSKYNCPVVSCGDYNNDESTEIYKAYMNVSNYYDTKYEAADRGLTAPTYHLGTGGGDKEDYTSEYWYRNEDTLRESQVDSYMSIDHIFASREFKVNYYDVISESRALYSSDHMPSYADLKL